MGTEIKAILFDSGRVLNYPQTGHWFITPNFFQYVDLNKYKSLPASKIKDSFNKAGQYIDSQKLIQTEEEEYNLFVEYYTIFSTELPELELNTLDIQNIAKDLVYNTEKYIFFDDALLAIEAFKKDYVLGVVSDAWPSLNQVFVKAGLRHYFSTFIISSKLGTSKPDKLMYQTALENINILPENAVFVDDSLKNCMGASKLGIHSVLLCRNKRTYYKHKITGIGKGVAVINNLEQLKKLKWLQGR